MKKIVLLLTITLLNIQAHAGEELASRMREISASFRVIGMVARGETLTEVHVEAARDLQKATAAAALIFPDNAQDDAAKLQYTRWMLELINASIEFEEEGSRFLQGEELNMEKVQGVLRKMSVLRRNGHGMFKPRGR